MDALGNPTGFHLTAGQAHDLEGSDVLLKDTPAQAVIADKAYDAQERVIKPLLESGQGRRRDSTAQHAQRAAQL